MSRCTGRKPHWRSKEGSGIRHNRLSRRPDFGYAASPHPAPPPATQHMQTPPQQPIGPWAVASLTVAIVVLLISGAISITSTSSSTGLFRETVVANAITHQLDALEGLVLNEETAQRGFLIWGRESYLEPYERSEAQLRARLADIEQALHDKR